MIIETLDNRNYEFCVEVDKTVVCHHQCELHLDSSTRTWEQLRRSELGKLGKCLEELTRITNTQYGRFIGQNRFLGRIRLNGGHSKHTRS